MLFMICISQLRESAFLEETLCRRHAIDPQQVPLAALLTT